MLVVTRSAWSAFTAAYVACSR
ncbi:hypothetical protein [Streptomyces sp. NBC_00988]